ncbi:hypothetical protein [Streptomyces sp. NPDC059278]|uniref:hypothetical protein n=1 Tax=Streptomyces sp. NPDC059278 TaxID=3346801 RepID=UPI0036890020
MRRQAAGGGRLDKPAGGPAGWPNGCAPWIVADALAGDVGPDIHEAGLVVARRLIGTG